MEEKTHALEVQRKEVIEKNRALERTQEDLQQQARNLTSASKYKSEFLSNMSHELRTPLNSLLILAQDLAANKKNNLDEEQVESAIIIENSGKELLNLINEILDLSKIEAGRMDLSIERISLAEISDSILANFKPLTDEKGLELYTSIGKDLPETIRTDRQKLEQIIRNLLSNAVKFTDKGTVSVEFHRPTPDVNLSWSGLESQNAFAISVTDTGIGIPDEKQSEIFEAFHQVDGTTSRGYGGTGLGLSISRELAKLLGGEIEVESEPEKGSTFTLYLPLKVDEPSKLEPAGGEKAKELPPAVLRAPISGIPSIPDDRETLEKGDRVILVIEDDSKFAKVLYNKCHSRGFKCLAAPTGEAGLELAARHLPEGIILDIRLPGMDGWAVLSALKDDMKTRHIPVHVISVEEGTPESLRRGAIGHATKPLNREELEQTFKKIEETAGEETKHILLVEDQEEVRRSIKRLIGNRDVKVDEAATGQEAMEAVSTKRYGCLVLDLRLPDMDGGDLLKKMRTEGLELPPVIVHTARELTEQEEMELREHAQSIVIKDVRSQERLLDEVSLFLHRMVEDMPKKKKQMIRDLHETDVLLKDKKVLVVDDDMRATFALSRLLSGRGMKPLKAENGERALRLLDEEPDVDIVFMDIMMPVMDGYETMKRIRAQARFHRLPVIALTAKAMPDDRKKCIDAGANDYLSKPVDQEQLISMMRVWLYR